MSQGKANAMQKIRDGGEAETVALRSSQGQDSTYGAEASKSQGETGAALRPDLSLQTNWYKLNK